MNKFSFRRTTRALLFLSALFLVAASDLHGSQGGRREYLTPDEVESIRNNQELDKRVGVFIKAAERRLLILTNPQAAAKEEEAAAKQAAEDAKRDAAMSDYEPTGSVVKGTRAELLSDIANILDEAITNVDDAVLHSEKSTLIPKAVRKLAEACDRMLPKLAAMRAEVRDEEERDRLELAVENARQILEAAKKVPAEEKKKGDEKKKN